MPISSGIVKNRMSFAGLPDHIFVILHESSFHIANFSEIIYTRRAFRQGIFTRHTLQFARLVRPFFWLIDANRHCKGPVPHAAKLFFALNSQAAAGTDSGGGLT
ncbi:MAG: hypothetical protein ACLSDO_04190 [Anaerotruncus colihominis]